MSLKRAGVAIYPIAASKNPNVAALEQIASESSAEHVFLATSLPAIIQYVHQISQEACKGRYGIFCICNVIFCIAHNSGVTRVIKLGRGTERVLKERYS